jgi:hypothetical protein
LGTNTQVGARPQAGGRPSVAGPGAGDPLESLGANPVDDRRGGAQHGSTSSWMSVVIS